MISREFYRNPHRDFADYVERDSDFASLPYSDLVWDWSPESEVHHFVHYFFPTERLGGVKQLGFLSFTGTSPERYLLEPYPHHRNDHIWTVAMTADAIARNNHLPERENNLLALSALLHDIAMPAGGDAIKALDPEALDEEKNWKKTIGRRAFKHIEKFGANPDEIDAVIKNIGMLGAALDAADRISYVTKDLYNLLGLHQSRINSDYHLLNLRLALSRNPLIGNIYKDVKLNPEKNDIYFINPDNLFNFLLLRAYLHKDLYLHPVNQGRDILVGELMKPFYNLPNGPFNLTPKRLRNMEDSDLLRFIGERYKPVASFVSAFPDIFHQFLVNQHPRGEQFESLKEAEARRRSLEGRGVTILGVKEQNGFDTAVSYKVATDTGVVPFAQADPVRAKQIEEIADLTKGFFVYYIDPDGGEDAEELLKYARSLSA